METILLLAHTDADGALPKPALEALAAAKTLQEGIAASILAVGIFGKNAKQAAGQLGGAGAAKYLAVEGDAFEQPRYASDAAAAEALSRAAGATIIIAPATIRLNRIASGVSHRLGGRVETHVVGVSAQNGAPVATRWFYRQRMVAQLTRTQRPWVLALDPGSVEAWQGAGASAEVESVTVELGAVRTQVTGIQAPPADQQTIRPEAELLFVAGAGWTKKQKDGQTHTADAAKLIHDFITGTKASLGSSKSLVDQGSEGESVLPFLTHMNQVGQTGSTPRHPKGLATCCHGEEPHVVGWRFISERRAVNLDAGCGWARGKADVLYVADAFEVMTKVNALLNS
jgi:electron transfer flavoprotein alpha subunit